MSERRRSRPTGSHPSRTSTRPRQPTIGPLAAVESAKADVGVAEADVELNETNLLKSRIVSPINGVVLKRNVDPGQTVASSLQAPILFTIAEDLTQMEVQVDVDEADVGKVKEGQHGTFSVDAYPDRKFRARIRELRYGSEVVQGVVTYKAVLSTDNSELLLRPGMTATAEIIVQQVAKALTVPNAALRYCPPAAAGFGTGHEPAPQASPPGARRSGRQASESESGPNRRVWVLKDGAPAAVPVRGRGVRWATHGDHAGRDQGGAGRHRRQHDCQTVRQAPCKGRLMILRP